LGCSQSSSHSHCHLFLGFQLNCLHVTHCTHRPMSLTHDTIPLFKLPSMHNNNVARYSTCTNTNTYPQTKPPIVILDKIHMISQCLQLHVLAPGT
jgi:hypothetical protein